MLKYKISGVKPFNDFFFRSCYYHQLIAGLECFGVDKDNLLLNSLTIIEEGFSTLNKTLFNEKELATRIGYKSIRCNINQRRLMQHIKKNQPVIVGVDCYYLESREDTFMSMHDPHFILVYGYDLETRSVNVVDHTYRNSSEYIEKNISMDNLLYANKMFKGGIHKRRFSCFVLKKMKRSKPFEIWEHIKKEDIQSNKNNSKKNLLALKQMFMENVLGVEQNSEKILEYLQALKTLFFSFSTTRVFKNDAKEELTISRVISGYSNLISLFWKMKLQNNFEYANKQLDNILKKVDEIIELENIIWGILEEACR